MRFVTSVESVRKHLKKTGDWIEIKKELTIGEDRRYRTAGMNRMRMEKQDETTAVKETPMPTIEVDFAHMAVARVEAYLVDWSEKKKISRSAIEALATEDFEEIDALILQHIEEMKADAKNAQSATQETSNN